MEKILMHATGWFFRKYFIFLYIAISEFEGLFCQFRLDSMRPLTDEESEAVFAKLAHYIGDNVQMLIDRLFVSLFIIVLKITGLALYWTIFS